MLCAFLDSYQCVLSDVGIDCALRHSVVVGDEHSNLLWGNCAVPMPEAILESVGLPSLEEVVVARSIWGRWAGICYHTYRRLEVQLDLY